MSQILPGLFLGGFDIAQNKETLQQIQCKHIMHVTSTFKPYFPEDFNYKVFDVNDMPQENLIIHFNDGVQFISQALKNEEVILVHCNAGISRSASFVIAYLIKEKGMSFDDAIAFVQKKRSCVFPNRGFIEQLRQYARMIKDEGESANQLAQTELQQQQLELQQQLLKQLMEPQPMTQITQEEVKQQSATQLMEPSQPVEIDQITQYSCKKCRKVLFTEKELQDHLSTKKAYNTKSHSLKEVSEDCSSIFISQMDWIELDPSESVGKIACPKCQEKIGRYYLYGAQCSCGRWVEHGFQIHKSKVDEIKPFTL